MKNLVVLHLESISRQRLAEFATAFPNTLRLMREGVTFDRFFSSATSTVMVLTYLFHANDFEVDTSTTFDGMVPARNNPSLFSILQDAGYRSNLICLNGHAATRPVRLRAWDDALPSLWDTNDFPSLFARFDELTDRGPFAIYVWDLLTHIEHSLALAPQSRGLTDQIERACAAADYAVGVMRETLERKGLLDDTLIVLYGDHGDDCWTHGYKGGLIHGTEPYTGIIATPFAIRDADLAPGLRTDLASTIDIAPTCLALLGIDAEMRFAQSGVDLARARREYAYAQNFTANQPDRDDAGIAKAFSITDRTYTLLASSRGLEMYAHRLDPGNHCNLLHFFALDGAGRLVPQQSALQSGHAIAAWKDNPQAVAALADAFGRMRGALAAHVDAKRAYIVERGAAPTYALDRTCLAKINTRARDAFFRAVPAPAPAARPATPAFEYSWKLK
jgi:hypothetical protein